MRSRVRAERDGGGVGAAAEGAMAKYYTAPPPDYHPFGAFLASAPRFDRRLPTSGAAARDKLLQTGKRIGQLMRGGLYALVSTALVALL